MSNQSMKTIAEAVRCEVDERTGKLYIVFEVIDPEYQIKLKKEWADDLVFQIINKRLQAPR